MANGIGVLIDSGTGITIGGTSAGAGNTVSGNLTAGIYLRGSSVSGTLIEGNEIGTDSTGTMRVARNQANPVNALQNAGVVIVDSAGNTVGGTTAAAQNVISGNYVGVMIAAVSGQANLNSVIGNRIGTDVSGSKPLGNIVGVYINGAAGNSIGGTVAVTGNVISANVISANTSVGIEVLGAASTANDIDGNTIGLAADGQGVFRGGDGLFTQRYGIFLQDASQNTIGGVGNVISGNQEAGILILSRSGNSSRNLVQGNDIGSGPGGMTGPGNGGYGVLLYNSPNNQVVLTGPTANVFGPNGLLNLRVYNGPLPVSQVLAQGVRLQSRSRTRNVKRTHVHTFGSVHQRVRTPSTAQSVAIKRTARTR
jgi:parallel beta-helix repeat protein